MQCASSNTSRQVKTPNGGGEKVRHRLSNEAGEEEEDFQHRIKRENGMTKERERERDDVPAREGREIIKYLQEKRGKG